VINLIPDQSVLKLDIGERIGLSEAQFERLPDAFFREIESKFAHSAPEEPHAPLLDLSSGE
jgi:hypothetical protein